VIVEASAAAGEFEHDLKARAPRISRRVEVKVRNVEIADDEPAAGDVVERPHLAGLPMPVKFRSVRYGARYSSAPPPTWGIVAKQGAMFVSFSKETHPFEPILIAL
jgi:hypothetical protein